MNPFQIKAALRYNGNIFTCSNNYAVPTWGWVTGKLYEAFRSRLFDENLQQWKTTYECTGFARSFHALADEIFGQTAGVPNNSDRLAMAEIWFTPDRQPDPNKKSGHAIVAVICDKGGPEAELAFCDPQNGTEWKMSEAEFTSIQLAVW